MSFQKECKDSRANRADEANGSLLAWRGEASAIVIAKRFGRCAL
jgi:hypothetical protein